MAEAREAAEKATRADPRRATPLGLLAGILARLGQSGQLPEYVARLREMAPGGLFWYHLLTSEIDSAADYYAKWIEQRDPEAIFLASAVFLKPIRSSPRWPGLAKMMNLPAEAIPASIGLSP
ncbi:MAG: hypothetical protein JO099_20235 [Acidobacteriia bacterium]|nr:hypothetical protein [Terriglobia bacterium]